MMGHQEAKLPVKAAPADEISLLDVLKDRAAQGKPLYLCGIGSGTAGQAMEETVRAVARDAGVPVVQIIELPEHRRHGAMCSSQAKRLA